MSKEVVDFFTQTRLSHCYSSDCIHRNKVNEGQCKLKEIYIRKGICQNYKEE